MISRLKQIFKKSYPLRFAAWLVYFNFIDILAMLFPGRSEEKDKKRVVFVKVDGIGDYVIWTASFEAFRTIFPSSEYERILVGNYKSKGLAENEPTFDRMVFIDNDRMIFGPGYRYGIMKQIRRLQPDIVINPRLTRDFLWGDSIVRCSGAKVRIGSEGLDNLMTRLQELVSARWYTKLVEKPDPKQHELISNLKFVNELDSSKKFGLTAPVNAVDRERPSFDLSSDYAVFFVGALKADKRWQTEKFIETAEYVSAKYKFQIVVCGGPGDEGLAEGFVTDKSKRVLNLVGATTLSDLERIIASAKLVVTNDTGAGHIAAAAKCPTVVVTPGNNVGRFFPYPAELAPEGVRLVSVLHEMPCFGCGWNCIYKNLGENVPNPCVADITVEDVVLAITNLLEHAQIAKSVS